MIAGIDHVAFPMRDTEAMIAFYRALGFDIEENKAVVCARLGTQMINFHRPELWPNERFTLRALAAVPPCADLCFEWRGSIQEATAKVAELGATVEQGPVERVGGRRQLATSIYFRDPDGNLLELMAYDREQRR
jgi:catechol 2,3-dioxygenase-like lactoylglutathione lyase family enzyme